IVPVRFQFLHLLLHVVKSESTTLRIPEYISHKLLDGRSGSMPFPQKPLAYRKQSTFVVVEIHHVERGGEDGVRFLELQPNGLLPQFLRVWNSGRLPIRRNDFDSELTLLLEGTELLSAEVSRRKPYELDIHSLDVQILG